MLKTLYNIKMKIRVKSQKEDSNSMALEVGIDRKYSQVVCRLPGVHPRGCGASSTPSGM